jgi:hypothetical protein
VVFDAILMIGIAMLALDDYVVDVLMRDLVGHDRRPTSFLLYLWLDAEQTRRDRPVQVSYVQLAESVGVSKSSAQVAVNWLVRRRLLSVSKDSITATPCYTVQKPWRDRLRSVPAHRD